MPASTVIRTIMPTPFLRREGDVLRQVARVTVTHAGAPQTGVIRASAQGVELLTPVTVQPGESTLEVEVAEVNAPCEAAFALIFDGQAVARLSVPWLPPKHWVVHVVQLSHHDVGYTDLASHVIAEQSRYLDSMVDMAEATRDFPEEARFRAVIESAWSIDHFLRTARPARAAAMLRLLRCGDVEVTALFGNVITELCGHETLARSVYHAFRLKRDYGIPLISAEHNDIPGFTWGLSQVLTEAGITLFCPGLPTYYNWGYPDATTFWDEAALFGSAHRPGAFWWQAPGGKRVLFWSNNQGCGGDCHADLPGLAARLQELSGQGYPYDVLRWPVQGGARDNSPYIDGYAHTIRAWNSRWAFPRLVSSTNARFQADLLPQLPADLPVWRGDVPGQDYPVGATSTAEATGVNRRNHAELPVAETLAAMAGALADYAYPHEQLFDAYEEVLWHDEHTWGFHAPCGPTQSASELEKAVHAFRAAALTEDVACKAMARIADAVHFAKPGLHLVVFNPLSRERSGVVTTPMKEFDNCGITMTAKPDGSLYGVHLHDRWHVGPQAELLEGKFDLVDEATGSIVPFQITTISSPYAAIPHAAQRLGQSAGKNRYGIQYELTFTADDVPPLGYRLYRLQPRADRPVFPDTITASASLLENAYYRLELDPQSGHVCRLLDKETGRELVVPGAPYALGEIIVRDPNGGEARSTCEGVHAGERGALSASLHVRLAAPGHLRIEQTITLYAREKRVDVAVALVKDPTPLLEVYLAFPFHLPAGRFRYEGPLSILDPAADLLPGAYADRLGVQNWVRVSDDQLSVLWSSREAPVASLARLWPGRFSPAHSAVVRADIEHPRQQAADFQGGAIYSLLTANNCGTNFSVTQSGSLLFRYSITTQAAGMSDSQAVMLGQQFMAPLKTLFTDRPGPRPLPSTGSFLAIDHPAVHLVALKRAEDGRGLIVRLWNTGGQAAIARLSLPQVTLGSAALTNLAEEDTGPGLTYGDHWAQVPLAAQGVATVRLCCDPKTMLGPNGMGEKESE